MKALDIHNAVVGRVSTRQDGSMGLSVTTPEIPTDGKLALLELTGKLARILIEPADQENVEAVVVNEANEKSPSKRLRAVLYRFWEFHLKPKGQQSWEEFYEKKMGQLIDHYKEQLP